jgi:hypothetical protein
MNRIVNPFIAVSFFIAGVLSCISTYWFVKTYLLPPTAIEIRGVLKLQTEPSDPSATSNPPNGYFVESTATDRFYVTGDLVKPYVGSLVLIKGTLSTVCSPDLHPCYPELQVKQVIQAPSGK